MVYLSVSHDPTRRRVREGRTNGRALTTAPYRGRRCHERSSIQAKGDDHKTLARLLKALRRIMRRTILVTQAKGGFLVIVRVIASKQGSALHRVITSGNKRMRLQPNGKSRSVGGMVSRRDNSSSRQGLLRGIRAVGRVPRRRRRGRQVVRRMPRVRQLTRPRLQGPFARPRDELSTGRPLLRQHRRIIRVKRCPIRLGNIKVPVKGR